MNTLTPENATVINELSATVVDKATLKHPHDFLAALDYAKTTIVALSGLYYWRVSHDDLRANVAYLMTR